MNHKGTIERRETDSKAKEGDREEERLNKSHKGTIERRETGSLAMEGDRGEEKLTHSQGYNRKGRDGLTGKGGRERRRETKITHKDTIEIRETG